MGRRIAVAYKWARNPQEALVNPDGTVDWSGAPAGLSEYDPVAIAMARQIADAVGAELVGISIGSAALASPAATKAALARGIDRLVLAADDQLDWADPLTTANLLAEMVKHVGDVELVICGDSSIDNNSHLVPPLLAGDLGWACLSGVLEVTEKSEKWMVRRRNNGEERISVDGPAVLATATDAVAVANPGMKEMLAARKKPVDTISIGQIGLDSLPTWARPVQTALPRIKCREQRVITADDVPASARELVDWLEANGLLALAKEEN